MSSAVSSRVVLVVGATGGTGRAAVQSLVRHSIPCCVLCRNRERAAALFGDRVHLIVGDTTDRASLAAAFAEPTPHGRITDVICSTGAGWNNSPIEVEHLGVANLALEAERAGVRHLVLVSSIKVERPTSLAAVMLNLLLRNVMAYKLLGENELRRIGFASSTMSYSIVRSGGLIGDGSGTAVESVVFGQGDTISGRVTRVAVGETLVQTLLHTHDQASPVHRTFEVVAANPNDARQQRAGDNDWPALFAKVRDDAGPLPNADAVSARHRQVTRNVKIGGLLLLGSVVLGVVYTLLQ